MFRLLQVDSCSIMILNSPHIRERTEGNDANDSQELGEHSEAGGWWQRGHYIIIMAKRPPADGSWKHNKTFSGFCTKRSVTRTHEFSKYSEGRITAEELKLVLTHLLLLGKVENIKIFQYFTFAPSDRLQKRKLMRWSSWWTRMGMVRSSTVLCDDGRPTNPPSWHHAVLDTGWDEAGRWILLVDQNPKHLH